MLYSLIHLVYFSNRKFPVRFYFYKAIHVHVALSDGQGFDLRGWVRGICQRGEGIIENILAIFLLKLGLK